MDTSTGTKPPRLRRKSSAFKLHLSRSSTGGGVESPNNYNIPPTPSTATSINPFFSSSDDLMMNQSPSISLNSNTTTSTNTTTTHNSHSNVPSPSLSSTLSHLVQLIQKRITAWTYLKHCAMGKVYWFNTVLLTLDDVKGQFPNDKMRARTIRFTILSMSLSPLLDNTQPASDFLRGLLTLVQEFESIPEEKFAWIVARNHHHHHYYSNGTGSNVGNGGGIGGGSGFKGSSQRGGGGTSSLFKLSSTKSRNKPYNNNVTSTGGGMGGGEFSNGLGSHELGSGSGGGNTIGSGANSSSGGGGGGGGGGGSAVWDYFEGGGDGSSLFVPNVPFDLDYFQVLTTTCELLVETYSKIYSYLGMNNSTNSSTSTTTTTTTTTLSNNSSMNVNDGSGKGGGGGAALSQGLAEVVIKIDGRLKKLIGTLSKEIDQLARLAIKNELENLESGIEGWGFGGGDTTVGTSSSTGNMDQRIAG